MTTCYKKVVVQWVRDEDTLDLYIDDTFQDWLCIVVGAGVPTTFDVVDHYGDVLCSFASVDAAKAEVLRHHNISEYTAVSELG